MSWAHVFGLVAPHLLHPVADVGVKEILSAGIFEYTKQSGESPELDTQVFQTIKVQLLAHRVIVLNSYNTKDHSSALFWELTQKGRDQMLEIRTIKKKDDANR